MREKKKEEEERNRGGRLRLEEGRRKKVRREGINHERLCVRVPFALRPFQFR